MFRIRSRFARLSFVNVVATTFIAGVAMTPGGKLVWIAPAPDGFQPSRNDVQTLRPNVIRDRAHLEQMRELLDAGAVRPPTIVRYRLADAAEAHRVSEARHLQGKLVLEVR